MFIWISDPIQVRCYADGSTGSEGRAEEVRASYVCLAKC